MSPEKKNHLLTGLKEKEPAGLKQNGIGERGGGGGAYPE